MRKTVCDSSRGVRPRRYAATTLPELVQTPAIGAIEALEFVGIAGSDTPLWPVSGPKE